MKKGIVIFTLLILALFSVSCIYAADTEDAIAISEDNLEIDQTTDDVIGVEEDMELASSGTNEILKADEQTFTQLNTTINGNADNDIYLNGSYKYSSGDDSFKDGIVINRDVNIYGNGHIIDGNNEARIFKINSGNVVFYNITFVNGTVTGNNYGGAINGNCKAINCIFKENQAFCGGAMYNGSAVNCIFTDNHADADGDAMFDGTADSCIFENNGCVGTTITNPTLTVPDFASTVNSGDKLTFNLTTHSGILLTNRNIAVEVFYRNGTFYRNYSFLSGDAWQVDLPVGFYNATCKAIEYGDINASKIIINIYKEGTKFFNDLNTTINGNDSSVINLNNDYVFDPIIDYKYRAGVIIVKEVIINGNYHTIDGMHEAKIFYVNATNVTIRNINFINGSSYYGGAIHWYGDNGLIANCNFINNFAIKRGGAVHWGDTESEDDSHSNHSIAKNGKIIESNFIANRGGLGGAVFWYAEEGNLTADCYFKDNYGNTAGAIYWKGPGGHLSDNCTFLNNTAMTYGGAVYWQGDNGTLSDNCRFINNIALSQGADTIQRGGGAVYWNGNSGIITGNCSFINNTADTNEGSGFLDIYRGGAAIYQNGRSGFISSCRFENNFATHYGGAIYLWGGDCKVWDCSFENNKATLGGGAISAYGDSSEIYDCNFVNNRVTSFTSAGGAIYLRNSVCSIHDCIFKDNYADNNGGAVYGYWNGNLYNCSFEKNSAYGMGGAVYWSSGGTVTDCSFIGNHLTGWPASGGAIYCTEDCYVYNSVFINNSASKGGAICCNAKGNVFNSIFINNLANGAINAINCAGNLNADYNWFGNNATNYDDAPMIVGPAVVDAWLFLNATSRPDTLQVFNTSEIIFKLYLYNNTGDISEYDNTLLLPINLTITSTNGDVDIHTANLGDSITYTATGLGEGSVTATIENVACTIALNIMANPNLSVENQVVTYGNVTIALNYIPNATGKVNITLTGKKGTFTYQNLDLNATIMLPDDIPVDEYNVTVSYSGDKNFFNATANATLTVNKANATLTINDVTLDYGTSANVTVTTEGATGIIAKINDKEAVVENNTISIPVLDAGTYTLTVTAIADSNHNNITKNVTITVNKAKTQINAKAVTATYNVNKNLVITLKDSTGKALSGVKITVKLKGSKTYTTDKNGQIKINVAKLVPKKYTAKITFAGNANYLKSTADVKVTVKKAKAKIFAKKKTYKANKKSKKFKIKLKDKNGKAIKKVKVRLIVKKIKKTSKGKNKKSEKKYKKNIKKTNKKGKITFKIKRNKKGKYLATVKFYGNKYYAKAVKKVKIKMK